MPHLSVTGEGTLNGVAEPFSFDIDESEFVYDLEAQAMKKLAKTVVSADGSLTWEWDASVDKELTIPVSLPIFGKIAAHPEVQAATKLVIELAAA
jgi:hypothetical protein